MEPILEIRQLNSFYRQGGSAFSRGRTVQVLQDINVTIGRGEALGLVGGIAGLVMTSQGAGLYCPYSLLCLGMRANNPNLSLKVGPFVLACGVCIALFSFLTIRCMAGRDVTIG